MISATKLAPVEYLVVVRFADGDAQAVRRFATQQEANRNLVELQMCNPTVAYEVVKTGGSEP